MMRSIVLILAALFCSGVLFLLDWNRPAAQTVNGPTANVEKKMPEVIVLGKVGKQGIVTFNHVKHNSGEYSLGGPIACIECHHTAQPASQIAKYPPLQTDWPKGRTTTLTAELFAKDPNGAGVAACRDCHARVGDKPKLMAEIPILKDPGSPLLVKLTNQLAIHQTCDSCHFQISFNKPDSKVPSVTNCKTCHKRSADQ